jgi:UDP-GlcNAc:undecaprenyl-phosphate/decaprenyl-phosphate GlcNAc-1-phosphate transferase
MMLFLLAFLVAFIIAAGATPLVKRAAVKVDLVARPTEERWHRAPVPVLGGVAIVSGFIAASLLLGDSAVLAPLIVGGCATFALGLADDVKHLRPGAKLALQIVIAVGFVIATAPLSLTGFRALDASIAVAWIVGMTNAFNLLDNVDGLAAGVALIASAFLAVALWPIMSGPVIIVLAAFLGATAGFLVYNFHPASIFMGDSGSLFLGFMLSATSLFIVPRDPRGASYAAVSVLILFVPIFDTTFVTLTRIMTGRSPIAGGRDHTSHRLIALGISERRAVAVHYLLTAAGGLIALGVLHAKGGDVGIALGLYVICLAALGIVLGHVEIAHGQADALMPVPPMLVDISYRNRALELLLDAALVGLAYYAAFAIRFQAEEFVHFLPYFAGALPFILLCQMGGLWASGKYRDVWRTLGAAEVTTILRGVGMGVTASVILVLYLYRFEGFSRLVFAIDAVILSGLLIGSRVAVSQLDSYLLRQRGTDRHVLIYGAGRRGVLLVHDLLGNRRLNLVPIGFVDDDAAKARLRIEGLQVLGSSNDLDRVLAGRRVTELLVSTPRVDMAQLSRIQPLCEAHHVKIRRLHLALEDVPRPIIDSVKRHA